MLFDLTVQALAAICIYTYLHMYINIFKEGVTKNKIGSNIHNHTLITAQCVMLCPFYKKL